MYIGIGKLSIYINDLSAFFEPVTKIMAFIELINPTVGVLASMRILLFTYIRILNIFLIKKLVYKIYL